MSDREHDDRISKALELLRHQASEALPSGGVGRMARTARSALGIAARAWSARRRGEEEELGEADLRSIEKVIRQLGELKGVPMKLGQMLGYLEVDLPEEMRSLLALLQTQSPPASFEQVERIVREDLGPAAETLLASMERVPASAASIGQVYRARLPDGTWAAIKVRYAEIEKAIRADFGSATAATAFASLMMPGVGATAREVVAEVEARLLEECNYELEADRQRLFGQLFQDDARIVVPRVLGSFCGPRVLATSWEEGSDFSRFAASAPQATRDRAGHALFDFYIGSLYRHGLFHADPHPGNYLFRDDGSVVVFDYGCVRRFEPDAVRAFVALAEAVRLGDEAGIRKALGRLGGEAPADGKAFAHVRSLLENFFGPMLRPGAHRIDGRIVVDMRQITRDKLAWARLRLPGSLAFLFRIRYGLYSVLSRLGAVCDWSAIERGYADELRSGGPGPSAQAGS
jgi:predicted unusual protein kinase regulating ubiquinone biosynthesis (AarF/ABC1/UbiB family)